MNYCKDIYDISINRIKSLKIPEKEINEIVSKKYIDACSTLRRRVANNFESGILKIENLNRHDNFDQAFEIAWGYKNSIHFYLDKVPTINSINTTIFDRIKHKKFCLNINTNNRKYAVYVSLRAYGIELVETGHTLYWEILVFDVNEPDKLLLKNLIYTFNIKIEENLRKVYIIPNKMYKQYDMVYCDLCRKCRSCDAKCDGESGEIIQYSIKYKDKNPECLLYKNDYLTPVDILKCAIHALECYENRDTILRKKNKKNASYNEYKVHIANNDLSDDKIVMMPLHEYINIHKEYKKCKSKGGHHASPATHLRRSYFRRSRNRGDYILKDGEFIYVGKKKGNYSLVSATIVNKESNRITIYKSSN